MTKQLKNDMLAFLKNWILPLQGEHNTEEVLPWITPDTSILIIRLSTIKRCMKNNHQPHSLTVFQSNSVELKKKDFDIAIAEDKVFASKNGSIRFKHFRQLKPSAISPHLEWKDGSARSSEQPSGVLSRYLDCLRSFQE